MFHESFMEGEVSWIFQGCFMIFKVVFRVFQGGFKKTLLHVAWHSSQLPEQKEGLFDNEHTLKHIYPVGTTYDISG